MGNDSDPKCVVAQWTETPPEIDGNLNDENWKKSTVIKKLVQHQPNPGAPTNLKTNIYLSYDSSHLYVGSSASRMIWIK